MIRDESNIEGLNEVVVRERAVYIVHCHAVLVVDLSGKRQTHPNLVSEDYGLTQQIGRRLHHEGQPGLLAPSARHTDGVNAVIFNPAVLSDPFLQFYLTCRFDPRTQRVEIEREPGDRHITYPVL